MKYKVNYDFKWVQIVFFFFLILISNWIFLELPFIRFTFPEGNILNGSISLLLKCIPKISFESYTYNFQTIIILSCGIILGSRLGLIISLIYIFLGLLGLPIFAFGGGIDYFKEPTFGYLLSFPLNAFLSGFLYSQGKRVLAILIPLAVTHIMGILYILLFFTKFLDFSWHLSFSMIGYDLLFSLLVLPIVPLITFFLNEITMQEIPFRERLEEGEKL